MKSFWSGYECYALEATNLTAKEEHLDPDLLPYTPPPNSPEAALLDGALLTPAWSANCRRSTPRRRWPVWGRHCCSKTISG